MAAGAVTNGWMSGIPGCPKDLGHWPEFSYRVNRENAIAIVKSNRVVGESNFPCSFFHDPEPVINFAVDRIGIRVCDLDINAESRVVDPIGAASLPRA
jgi:hypothetical protein